MSDYFSGPVLLQTLCAVAMVILAFAARDKDKPFFLPLLALLFGLIAVGGAIWGGVSAAREKEASRLHVLSIAAPRLRHILTCSEEQFSAMAIASGELALGSTKEPTAEQVLKVLSQLKPTGPSIMRSVNERRRLNWLEFMNQYNLKTIELVDELYQFVPYLDSQLVAALGELRDCYHFKEVQLLANGAPVSNETLAFIPFAEYQSKLAKVRRYYIDNNLEAHGAKTPAMAAVPFIPQHRKASNKPNGE